MSYGPSGFTGSSLPAGVIVMWAGLLSAIPSGWVLCDGTGGTPDLRSKFIKGAAAGVDPGVTGGSNTASYTPAGTVAAPTFTGSAATLTHSGTAIADHASHTHSVTSNVAVGDHAAHTHTTTATGTISQPTFTGNAVTAASTTNGTKLVTSNTTGTGVSPITTATGTVSQPTFTGNAVASGNPSATLTHSVTNNAVTSGGPSATLTHSVTQPNDHSYTPAGTNSAPTFTGTGASIATEPVYYSLAYIQKT